MARHESTPLQTQYLGGRGKGASMNSRSSWSTKQVSGWLGIHSETMALKQKAITYYPHVLQKKCDGAC